MIYFTSRDSSAELRAHDESEERTIEKNLISQMRARRKLFKELSTYSALYTQKLAVLISPHIRIMAMLSPDDCTILEFTNVESSIITTRLMDRAYECTFKYMNSSYVVLQEQAGIIAQLVIYDMMGTIIKTLSMFIGFDVYMIDERRVYLYKKRGFTFDNMCVDF